MTDAFCQLEIFNPENRVSRQRLAEFFRHTQVAGAQHSFVQLIEQQQIGESKDRVSVQNVDDALEPRSAFDVPLDYPEKRSQPRPRAPQPEDSRLVEQLLQFSRMPLIKFRAPKFIEGCEAAKRGYEMLIV